MDGNDMSYIIRNNDTGLYVSPPGMHNSYTKCIQHARKFPTLEDAQHDCCGNESVQNTHGL